MDNYNSYYGGNNTGGQQGGYYGGGQQGGYYGGGQQGGYYGGGQQGGYYGGGPQGGYGQGVPYSNPYMQSGYNDARFGGGGRYVRMNLPALPNNAINYIIFLPILALILENFAANIFLGILLWALVIIFMRYAAYRDAKQAVEKNICQESSKTVALISPLVYIFQRSRGLGRGMGRFVAACLAVMIAVFYNGFTRSAIMTPQSFIEYTKSRYLTEVGLYEKLDSSEENYEISERADIFIEEQDWSYTEFDGKKSVIMSGEFSSDAPKDYRNKEIELKFVSNFDGYNVKTMEIEIGDCSIDGEKIKGKEKEELLKGIFHDWEEPEQKSDDSSSEPDVTKKKDKDTYDA